MAGNENGGNFNSPGSSHLAAVADNLELCNRLFRALLPEAVAAMRGQKPWTPSQTRLFCALMDRAAPSMSVSFAHIRHSSDNPRDLSVEELEAIAAGQSPNRGVDQTANVLELQGFSDGGDGTVTAQSAAHDARLSTAPDAHTRDVQAAPTPTPLSAQAGGVGADPPPSRRDVLPPRHPDTSDHFQNVPTTNDLRAFIDALPPDPHQGPAFLHAPHVPRGSRDPRRLPDPPAGPPHRFKVLTPGNSILYVADLREFARTHGLDHKRLSALATAHARNPSRAPSAHKGYIPVDTQCP